jgi:transglutaminase-like putative cysteine protease
MNKIYVLALLLFCTSKLAAQDFPYGTWTVQDVSKKSSTIDSNANAEVLREFGSAGILIDENTGGSYVDYLYHARIKIFNKNGFDAGSVLIPLYIYGSEADLVTELKATTMNFVNGMPVSTDLDRKQIFTEKKTKYLQTTRFTMPNLKEGSIIEYSYRVRKYSIFNFSSWEFQREIPKVSSEFVALIPAVYNFNVSLRGGQPLTSQNGELQKECLRLSSGRVDCSKLTYIMTNIPAFTEEAYMTAASNFKSAINFELSDIQQMNGGKRSITKTWKDVDNELTSEKTFGGQMKRKDIFMPLLPEILKNATDDLSKAKAIYNFIKKSIRWDEYTGKYSENQVKKAMDTHTGNIGDINLALIAALSAANLDAEAVILSTRSNGMVNNLYPVISEFNYVIAKLNIGDKSYLLDASEPLLPFGLLPMRCINDKGRVINLKKPSYWYDLKASEKDAVTYNLIGKLGTDGIIRGELVTYSRGYAAYGKRAQIAEASSVDEYVRKLYERMPNMKVVKHELENVDSLDNTLIERYQVEIKAFDVSLTEKNQKLFYNPFFIERITKNPFNLNERSFPVDLGAATEKRISISLTLPGDYIIDEQAKDLAMSLPLNSGKYITTTSLDHNTLAFNLLFQLNKPIYSPEEYLSLKEFYSRIIQQQKVDLVLKSTK